MKSGIIIAISFVLLIPIPIFAPSHPECQEGFNLVNGICQPASSNEDEWTMTEYRNSFNDLIENRQYHEASKLIDDARWYFGKDVRNFYLDDHNVFSKLSMHKEALVAIRDFNQILEKGWSAEQKKQNMDFNVHQILEAQSLYSLGEYSDAIKTAEMMISKADEKSAPDISKKVVYGSSFTIIGLSNEMLGNDASQDYQSASVDYVIKDLNCFKANFLMNTGNYHQAIKVVDDSPADIKCGAVTERVSLQDTKIESLKRLEVIDSSGIKLSDSDIICGVGTIEKNGQCVPDHPNIESSSKGGGCIIATATYGSELAPQVQQLRELRDNSLLQTESGTSFVQSFNEFYYSFSPHIADYERENPIFKELIKLTITPMISSLSILNYVEMDSEIEVLGYGISLIILNLVMYVGIPVVAVIGIRKHIPHHT